MLCPRKPPEIIIWFNASNIAGLSPCFPIENIRTVSSVGFAPNTNLSYAALVKHNPPSERKKIEKKKIEFLG